MTTFLVSYTTSRDTIPERTQNWIKLGGNVTQAEAEERYCAMLEDPAMAA